MEITLRHVSGLRPDYTSSVTEEDLIDLVNLNLIVKDFDNNYYLFGQYLILDTEHILNNTRPWIMDIPKAKPLDISRITVQNTNGEIEIINNPDLVFEFDGTHILYENNRVLAVNNVSTAIREGGGNALLLTKQYGVIPKTTSIVYEFPEFIEEIITVSGYNPYSRYKETVTYTYSKPEFDIALKRFRYLTQSNEIRITHTKIPITITHINNKRINTKKVYKKYKIKEMNA